MWTYALIMQRVFWHALHAASVCCWSSNGHQMPVDQTFRPKTGLQFDWPTQCIALQQNQNNYFCRTTLLLYFVLLCYFNQRPLRSIAVVSLAWIRGLCFFSISAYGQIGKINKASFQKFPVLNYTSSNVCTGGIIENHFYIKKILKHTVCKWQW